MVLEKLGESLQRALRRLAGATHVDEDLIREIVLDIKRALIAADVDVHLVQAIAKRLEERSLREKAPAGMSPREHVLRTITQELLGILGKPRRIEGKGQRLLLVGLYGQGKTTTAAKLARLYKRDSSVALVAADVHRPAAYDQLQQLAQQLNVPFYGEPGGSDAVAIVREGRQRFADADVLIVDSSGRHALEKDLIDEIRRVAEALEPTERILVLDAAVGQQAGRQAKAFHEAVGVTATIVTKLDGTAKGGGALSAVAETRAPIVFIGTGEKVDDFERFEPTGFLGRLLGMGDLAGLLEKAQEALDSEAAEKAAQKLLSGKFTLHDLYEQMEAMSKVGTMEKFLQMLPGVKGVPQEQRDQTQERLRKFRVIMDSMTDDEMSNPRLLKSSRLVRIARGAGVTTHDVKELLKHYEMTQKTIKSFSSNRKMRRQLMKQFGGGLPP
jgi:signal recognition particle subunit SRP54